MKFKSKYPEYGFYVDGKFRQFHGGEFATEDEKEIEVLKTLSDVEFEAQPEEVAVEEVIEAEPQAEEVVAEVKPSTRRSSKK